MRQFSKQQVDCERAGFVKVEESKAPEPVEIHSFYTKNAIGQRGDYIVASRPMVVIATTTTQKMCGTFPGSGPCCPLNAQCHKMRQLT